MLPDVPTLDEQGIKDVDADNCHALLLRRRRRAGARNINAAVTAGAATIPTPNSKLIEAGALNPAPECCSSFPDFCEAES